MKITAQQLREVIATEIENSIEIRRRSIGESDRYSEYANEVSEEEITDFVFSNALFDSETVKQLFDPGLLGFAAKTADATPSWLKEFKKNVSSWASTNAWLGGDAPFWNFDRLYGIDESTVWTPDSGPLPHKFRQSTSAILLAENILQNKGHLSELDWRVFERLIAELLERDGFKVELTRGSKDGGIDVIADKFDTVLGNIRTIWQAKRFDSSRKVELSTVRELSGILGRERTTKAYLATTSTLTNGALNWIRQDHFRLDYKDHAAVQKWVLGPIPKLLL